MTMYSSSELQQPHSSDQEDHKDQFTCTVGHLRTVSPQSLHFQGFSLQQQYNFPGSMDGIFTSTPAVKDMRNIKSWDMEHMPQGCDNCNAETSSSNTLF
jgi:hypothetical protein